MVQSSQTSSNLSSGVNVGASKTSSVSTSKKKQLPQQSSLSSLVDRFTSRRQQSLPQMQIPSSLNICTPPITKDNNVRRSFNFKNLFSSKSSSKQQTPPSTKSPTSLLQRTASTIKFRKDNSSISPPKLSTLEEDNDQFDTISQASTGKLIMRKGQEKPWRNFFTRSFISSADSGYKKEDECDYEKHKSALQSPRIAHRRRVSVIGDVESDRKIFANKYAAFAPSPADCRKLDLLFEKQFKTTSSNPRSQAPSVSCFTSDDDIEGEEDGDEVVEYQSDNRVLTTPRRRRGVQRMKSSRTLPRLNICEGNGALLASPSVPDYSTRAFTTPRKLRGGVQKRWKRREEIQRRRSVNRTYIESAVLESSEPKTNREQIFHRIATSAIELPLTDNAKNIPKRLHSVAGGGDGQLK